MLVATRLQSEEGSCDVILKDDEVEIVHCSSCPWYGTPARYKGEVLEEIVTA
jgi:hypothetical protein